MKLLQFLLALGLASTVIACGGPATEGEEGTEEGMEETEQMEEEGMEEEGMEEEEGE